MENVITCGSARRQRIRNMLVHRNNVCVRGRYWEVFVAMLQQGSMRLSAIRYLRPYRFSRTLRMLLGVVVS